MKYDIKWFDNKFNVGKKIEKAIDYRYSNLPKHKRRSAFAKDYDNMYISKNENNTGKGIESSLKQWIPGRQKPSIEKLMSICNVLDCDIDYFLTEQAELKKEIANASKITGLSYDTIEIFNNINTVEHNQTKTYLDDANQDYMDKRISFLIDYMMKNNDGRRIFWNMFLYLFKSYNLMIESDGISVSHIVELRDKSSIDDRNIKIMIYEIAEKVFYNNITTGLVEFKEHHQTKDVDISSCEYTPSIDTILKQIDDANIKIQERKEDMKYMKEHSKFYIPEENDFKLQELQRKKDDLIIKLKKLYGIDATTQL